MPDIELLSELRQHARVDFVEVRRWTFGKHEGPYAKGHYELGVQWDKDLPPVIQVFERDEFIEMAKEILRTLQPSVEDEILASLRQIQAHLSPQEKS